MTTPARSYAAVTQAVDQIIVDLGGNDLEPIAYQIARAALLQIRASKGSKVAAEKAYALADELAVTK